MAYLLDTDTLTHLYQGHHRVVQRLRQLSEIEIGTTVVTRIEMLRGRIEALVKAGTGAEVLRAQERLRQTEALLAQLRVIGFDPKSASAFDRLRAASGSRTRGMSHADLMIASIALAQEAILVTRNRKHFETIPRLRLENWVD